MAFALANDKELPQHTTVASYTVTRLGVNSTFRASFVETVDDVIGGVITAADDLDGDGLIETLQVAALSRAPYIVGKPVTLGEATEPLGTVASLDQENDRIVLAAGVPVGSVAVGQMLRYRLINAFGETVNRKATSGRVWDLELGSLHPPQLARMASILGNVYFKAGVALLTKLGVPVEPAALVGALQALAAEGTNIDSFIVGELEQLEEDRRLGQVISVNIGGDAPQA